MGVQVVDWTNPGATTASLSPEEALEKLLGNGKGDAEPVYRPVFYRLKAAEGPAATLGPARPLKLETMAFYSRILFASEVGLLVELRRLLRRPLDPRGSQEVLAKASTLL